jgi:hypothetical protein
VDAYRKLVASGVRAKTPNIARLCSDRFGNANLFGGVIQARNVH